MNGEKIIVCVNFGEQKLPIPHIQVACHKCGVALAMDAKNKQLVEQEGLKPTCARCVLAIYENSIDPNTVVKVALNGEEMELSAAFLKFFLDHLRRERNERN